MLRERAVGESLWESVLPVELRVLPVELGRVDALLDEDRFLAVFRRRLTARTGRPTIPIETYLRLMFLKYRYRLGYETLVREVSDSFTWRRFCRIAIDARVPDSTTLIKLTNRLGPGVLDELHEELLRLAVEQRVLRSRRLRVDTTVVESDTRYPTDSGLCAHAVSRLVRLARRIERAGLVGGQRLRDRRRSVGKRVRQISGVLARGGCSRPTIDRLTGEIYERARATIVDARRHVERARAGLAGRAALLDQLERDVDAAEQVLVQTATRLGGQRTIQDRRISLVDADARPIRRGKPTKPTEFGYKARVADMREGFVICDIPERGNPADDQLLGGVLDKAQRARLPVVTVLADRGFGTSIADDTLRCHGIRDAVIPRRGNAAPIEKTSGWRRRYRFRNGCEARISQLKRKGLARTRLRGLAGAQTWVGGVTLAHNLHRFAALTA